MFISHFRHRVVWRVTLSQSAFMMRRLLSPGIHSIATTKDTTASMFCHLLEPTPPTPFRVPRVRFYGNDPSDDFYIRSINMKTSPPPPSRQCHRPTHNPPDQVMRSDRTIVNHITQRDGRRRLGWRLFATEKRTTAGKHETRRRSPLCISQSGALGSERKPNAKSHGFYEPCDT